jgi:cytoskeletal protein CcmA (bactofilin family)
MNINDFKNIKFTVLGAQSKLSGEFEFMGDLTICSQVEGKIRMLDEGKVVIERNGYVNGTLICDSVEIFGHFQGTIQAKNQVIVRPNGQLNGELLSGHISVHPGAIVNMEAHTQE